MKTVDQHLRDLLDAVRPLPSIHLNLLEAHGCLLADEVAAPDALPAFDNSSMDGYAVRAGDLVGASETNPITLPVVGDIPAGSTGFFTVGQGACARIMTGAPTPKGADAVVPVEWTDGALDRVRITRQPDEGQNIRRKGEDVEPGEVVLAPGRRLGAPQIGLLAAIGRDQVRVRPKPRVAIMSTGSELVEPGRELAPGQIVDANSYALTTAVTEAGCVAHRHGIVPDDKESFLEAIDDQLMRADVIVTSGGVSMGAHDIVKEVLSEIGTVRFERVAMQPGMPQGYGRIGPDNTPIFTLPGNPVSAYLSLQLFVRQALQKMAGFDPKPLPTIRARLTSSMRSPDGKRSFARARLDFHSSGAVVEPVGGHGSHLIADLAEANSLIVVPEAVTRVEEGENVSVMMLRSASPEWP